MQNRVRLVIPRIFSLRGSAFSETQVAQGATCCSSPITHLVIKKWKSRFYPKTQGKHCHCNHLSLFTVFFHPNISSVFLALHFRVRLSPLVRPSARRYLRARNGLSGLTFCTDRCLCPTCHANADPDTSFLITATYSLHLPEAVAVTRYLGKAHAVAFAICRFRNCD